jgi:hypothetical protein
MKMEWWAKVFPVCGALAGFILIYEALVRMIDGHFGMLPIGLLTGGILAYVSLCYCWLRDKEKDLDS